MSVNLYQEEIIDLSRNPLNFGDMELPDAKRHEANMLCGDSVDIRLRIEDSTITDIKFTGAGCAIFMACASTLTEMIKGKSVEFARNVSKNDLLSELGLENIQAVRIKCALLSLKALKMAIYEYISKNSAGDDELKNEADNLY